MNMKTYHVETDCGSLDRLGHWTEEPFHLCFREDLYAESQEETDLEKPAIFESRSEAQGFIDEMVELMNMGDPSWFRIIQKETGHE
jgi:hypothetical protein